MKEWITGRNPVYEVLKARKRHIFRLEIAEGTKTQGQLANIVHLAHQLHLPVTYIHRRQFDKTAENHQGIRLEVSQYPYAALHDIFNQAQKQNEPPFILILDTIQNPQNLGTLLRTAEAVGIHGVILPLAHAAGVTPAVVHASAGATEHLLIAQSNLSQAITTFKQAGIWVIGLEDSPQAQPLQSTRLDIPLALVVGNEGEGLRSLTRKSCDLLLKLPMRGNIASLNAAVAGSIVLYAALQARQTALFSLQPQ
ncbi:MAG: 23S rRNA (guanosine(2251)-2'-O)-methyltransferase RlmB [Anaerolineae bacterium]|nr:23S rRNA (guanosine(2251)-2'-O)-methyltransferase RlmB [Anaerolineae bacterium]